MIRMEPVSPGRRPAINPMRGEFEAVVDGELRRFDTRLSTVAAIEAACGDRAVVEVLNGIITGRRAKDQIPLLAAALASAAHPPDEPDAVAARANVGEAEAFVLALIFALGFKVDAPVAKGGDLPLDGRPSGDAGGNSRSAG